MTTLALTLPLDRISPVRVPTRDLVLGGTDSVTLLISVVDRDSPDALPIELSGGIGGPAVSLFVWPDSRGCHGPYFGGWGYDWDYGWGGWYGAAPALWTGLATLDDMTTGTFAIKVPAGTMSGWPRRCRWVIFFDTDGGGEAELLAEGRLHIRPMLSRAIDPLIMLTDPDPAVLTDPNAEAIFLTGSSSSAFLGPAGTAGLPVASVSTLGGIKTDDVTTMVDPGTGVLTTIARLG
jgi:hypothetical protein